MSIPRLKRNVITNGLVGDDKEERERQRAELNNQLDELYSWAAAIAGAGTTGELAAGDEKFVLHGDTLPDGLEDAALHRDLTGDDLHEPKPHRLTHEAAGSDAFAWPSDLDASARGLREVGGPTQLAMGQVADQDFLKRNGSTIIGSVPANTGHIHSISHEHAAPHTAAVADTWYTEQEWCIFGQAELEMVVAQVGAVMYIQISAGTWDIRLRDVTNGVTILDFEGMTATDRYLPSNTYPANWPASSTEDIEIQYQRTAGVAGNTIEVQAMHVRTVGSANPINAGFLSPLPILGLAA